MNQIKELFKTIWFPLLILVLLIIVFMAMGGNYIRESLVGSFGGALVGIILGFVAEMVREGISEFQNKKRDRKTYLRLLEEDAKNAHRTVWLYKGLMENPDIPSDIKSLIPAEFDLRYWKQLSRDKEFLRFGSEKPFDSIFDIMWNLEKVNREIEEAKLGKPQAYQFAKGFYHLLIEDEETHRLLLNFMKESEINEMEAKWVETAKKSHKKY